MSKMAPERTYYDEREDQLVADQRGMARMAANLIAFSLVILVLISIFVWGTS